MNAPHPPFIRVGTPQRGGTIAVADHASNLVPDDIELGIPEELMERHIAVDIGTAGVANRLARKHGIAAHIANVSRLVIDLHRNEGDDGLVVQTSDGHTIPGNIGANVERRIARYHRPYHEAFAQMVAEARPSLILAIHSFTPVMKSTGEKRPWDVGLLYNQDDSAARVAIDAFAEMGFTVGDNEPYSGKQLNATMDRHAEANGIPYLTIEVRQDLVTLPSHQAVWADRIAQVAEQVQAALAT
ncbi:MAG: N-formylglutamate amidohydrolase [Citromicrobium sp.]|nr:N-formylglutamate amidohydrolase [Citromicrobium sp.]|tara:strand:- start:45 stop:773 length:729 start_codon:yes stop_codon:yes gene_type:complete